MTPEEFLEAFHDKVYFEGENASRKQEAEAQEDNTNWFVKRLKDATEDTGDQVADITKP